MIRVPYEQGDYEIRHTPLDARSRARRLATASYSIANLEHSLESTERSVVAATATAVDTVSTTLAAAAGPLQADSRQVTLDSGTGVVAGHHYLIAEGEVEELVRVDTIASDTVRLVTELRESFTTSATWQGIEHVATFPSAQAADEVELERGSEYVVDWTYTIDGTVWRVRDTLRVERTHVTPSWVTTTEFLELFPELARRTRNQEEPQRALTLAAKEIHSRLRAARIDPAQYHSEDLALAQVYRAAMWTYRWLDDEQQAKAFEYEYQNTVRSQVTGMAPEGTVETSNRYDTATNKRRARVPKVALS